MELKPRRNAPNHDSEEFKYRLYEASVQSPEVHLHWFNLIYQELLGRSAHRLREDFCGTFLISKEWVAADPRNTALALDIDPAPLSYGKAHHLKALTSSQRKRLRPMRKNVISITRPATDLIVACNFSFCIFKERRTLVEYFRNCYRSLDRSGALILELAGGPGMIAPMRETRTVKLNGKSKFTYIWHQKSFNPITRDGLYAIHFKFSDRPHLNETFTDAFTYDWRMWTIPEIRDALAEAGFQETAVYWETEHKGEGTGEFVRTDQGDNAYAWITYIAGVKKPSKKATKPFFSQM